MEDGLKKYKQRYGEAPVRRVIYYIGLQHRQFKKPISLTDVALLTRLSYVVVRNIKTIYERKRKESEIKGTGRDNNGDGASPEQE